MLVSLRYESTAVYQAEIGKNAIALPTLIPAAEWPDRRTASEFVSTSLKTCGRIAYCAPVREPILAGVSWLFGAMAVECARRRMEGGQPLLSLSKNDITTGGFGRSNAWRIRTVPPEGAFDELAIRFPPSPVRDHCIQLHSQLTISSAQRLPRPVRWCVVLSANVARPTGLGCGTHQKMEWPMLKRLHREEFHTAASKIFHFAQSLRLDLQWLLLILLLRQKPMHPPSIA